MRWGAAAEFFLLDERSCRTATAAAACTPDGGTRADLAPQLPSLYRILMGLPAAPPAGCLAALARPEASMLGPEQLRRFLDALGSSTATFKFVVSEVAISPLLAAPYDRWEGYGAERATVLSFIRERNIPNVFFLTADLHANLSQDVKINRFTETQGVAREFITGPIAAETMQIQLKSGGVNEAMVERYRGLVGTDCLDLNTVGYGLVEVDPAEGTATVTLKNERGEVLSQGGCREVFSTKR
jgi:phosphodiesterase/alkaline phosphatase D-like protein